MSIDIIRAAEIAYKKHWQSTSDESTGDKQASAATKKWQDTVKSTGIIDTEVSIGCRLNQRIDVIDYSTETAYEMKVSSKNPDHEFYKDIFKVIIYNQNHPTKVKRFVFIIGEKGARQLNRGLAEAVKHYITNHELNIEVKGIKETI